MTDRAQIESGLAQKLHNLFKTNKTGQSSMQQKRSIELSGLQACYSLLSLTMHIHGSKLNTIAAHKEYKVLITPSWAQNIHRQYSP